VFLFDEPLSNLDAKLRVQTRAQISKLHQRLQTTFIYVTHDQTEAMTMATRIAVINKGILQQVDTPQQLYDYPDNMFVAGFIGSPSMNFFNGKIVKENGSMILDLGSFKVKVPDNRVEKYEHLIDQEIIFGIRPEDIHNPEYAPPSIIAEQVKVGVDVTELMGNEIFLYLVEGDHNFVARVDPRTRVEMGDKITVTFNMDNMHIFDPVADPDNPVAVR
jgi:multiple sugar transport system ATP-binding protein